MRYTLQYYVLFSVGCISKEFYLYQQYFWLASFVTNIAGIAL